MKKFNFIKILDISIIAGVVSACLIVAGVNLISSRLEYDAYYKQTFEENKKLISNPVDIVATLKEGKAYYKNGLASPVESDFDVSIKYLEYGTTDKFFLEPINTAVDKFTISYDKNNFFHAGGDITFHYKTLTKAFNFSLLDIEPASLNIIQMPYRSCYLPGQTFDSTGMEIEVIYNDGSKSTADLSKITFDNKSLSLSDSEVSMTYTDGAYSVAGQVPVTVLETIVDGSVVALFSRETAYVNDGTSYSNAPITVLGRYESGNMKTIPATDYIIKNKDAVATFGTNTPLKVELKDNAALTCEIPIVVKARIEGENTTIINGEVVNETEYIQNLDGSITSSGHTTKTAGNFAGSIFKGLKAGIEFKVRSSTETKSDLSFRCANSYLIKENGAYVMKPLQINLIANLVKVNDRGEESFISLSNDIVLKGTNPYTGYAPLYNIYNEFTIKDLDLDAGENTFRLMFKNSSLVTNWNESPSTMNIDYVEFTSDGLSLEEPEDIESINFAEDAYLYYRDSALNINPAMVYVDSHSASHELNPGLVKFEVNDGSKLISSNETTVTATYVKDSTIKVTKSLPLRRAPVKVEAESMVAHGSSAVTNKTSAEYENCVATGNNVTVVSGLNNSATKYSSETSLTFTVNIGEGEAGNRRLFMRVSNSNLSTNLGTDKAKLFVMFSHNLNQVMNVVVNGETISDFSGVIPELSFTDESDALWWSFFTIYCGELPLVEGENTIKFVCRKDGIKNARWSEVAVPFIDYITLA